MTVSSERQTAAPGTVSMYDTSGLCYFLCLKFYIVPHAVIHHGDIIMLSNFTLASIVTWACLPGYYTLLAGSVGLIS